MGEQRQYLRDATGAANPPDSPDAGPGPSPRPPLSEFERAQIRRIAEQGAALAAAIVQWHRDQSRAHSQSIEGRISHGLAVAALGALIMQILAWVRLVEPADIPPATLRSARDVIFGADPEAEPTALDTQARALLIHALDVKAKARLVSRHW
ncbi:hypothetical protein WV31_20740 [Magnetospirillum sp. ME-1]|uniref:hypothetical protein n=1 Tax=Magnetospirillum sp. ME-1 TaxID=1639348 RepID=UPI000A17EE17|nr:hypothetical protein [Magnetospirillum sp. ME-1]ARJ67901.1 hypothetical protein WV31_20740 [Magnetospirillum sp. ME-1]